MLRMLGILNQNRKGQAMVESAIVLCIIPVLLIMFNAVLYFGRAMTYKIKIQNAARYVAIKEARDESYNLSRILFKNRPAPSHARNINGGTDTFQRIYLGLFFAIGPNLGNLLWNAMSGENYEVRWWPHIGPGLYTTLLNPLPKPGFTTTCVTTVPFQPGLRFVGNRPVRGDCGLDANTWKNNSSYFGGLLGFKNMYRVHYLLNPYHFGWLIDYSTISTASGWNIDDLLAFHLGTPVGIWLFLFT